MHILQDFLTGRGGLNGFLHLLPIMDPVLRTSHTQLFGRGEKVIVHMCALHAVQYTLHNNNYYKILRARIVHMAMSRVFIKQAQAVVWLYVYLHA